MMEIINSIQSKINPVRLELGLSSSAHLEYEVSGKTEDEITQWLVNDSWMDTNHQVNTDVFLSKIKSKLNGNSIFCCGFEFFLTDIIASENVESLTIIPNSTQIDVERIALNYISYPEVSVLDVFQASNRICPETTILVPIYPLEDGSLLSYAYPSKLLTLDARKNSYQIVGMDMCSLLPIQYGHDPTGFCIWMTPQDPSYFTEFIKLY